MEGKVFQLRGITNLHMGSGEANFNFIDNQVQRDPITGYPVMHSSGIKGALREHFTGVWKDSQKVVSVFGGESDKNKTQGTVSFLEGKILFLPVRSNKRSYFLGTTVAILREYFDFISLFKLPTLAEKLEKIDVKKNKALISENISGLYLEDLEAKNVEFSEIVKEVKEFLGIQEEIAIFDDEYFKTNISSRLPVIARNCLENGVSVNLWYEEVVPRESRFYMGIINSQNFSGFQEFTEELENNIIQLGANATIGYGYTKFQEVK